jgi:hypothetical protein
MEISGNTHNWFDGGAETPIQKDGHTPTKCDHIVLQYIACHQYNTIKAHESSIPK